MNKNSIKEDIKILEKKIEDYEPYKNIEYCSHAGQILQEEHKAIEHILSDYKRVLKENEELNNRCKNLDEEAQAYVEELMGDSTLKDRIINRLNKENEELKSNSNDSVVAIKLYSLQKENEQLRTELNSLKENNEELLELANNKQWISPCYVAQNYISKQKIKDMIEGIQEEGYWLFTTDRDSDKCVEFLQELLGKE